MSLAYRGDRVDVDSVPQCGRPTGPGFALPASRVGGALTPCVRRGRGCRWVPRMFPGPRCAAAVSGQRVPSAPCAADDQRPMLRSVVNASGSSQRLMVSSVYPLVLVAVHCATASHPPSLRLTHAV